MMEKEAKTNLKIIISAVILLAVMIGIVDAIYVTFENLQNGTKLSGANNSFIFNVSVMDIGSTNANITNITFWFNNSGASSFTYIGKNQSYGDWLINGSNNFTTYGWDLSSITNGTYTVNITVNINGSTDTNSTVVYNISIDAVFPSITSSYPVDGSYSNGLLKIAVDDANLQQCNVSTNVSGTWATNFTNTSMNSQAIWTINLTQSNYQDSPAGVANYTWNVWCNDTFGNINTSLLSTNDTFVLDTVSPVVNIRSPIDNYNTSSRSLRFEYNVTDINLDACLLYTNHSGLWGINQTNNSIAGDSTNITTNLTIANDAMFRWNVWCNDSASNGAWNLTGATTMLTNNWTITVDTTRPSITINNPLNGSGESSKTVVFNFSVTELTNIDTCKLKVGYNTSDSGGITDWGFYNVTWDSSSASYHTSSYNFNTTTTFIYDMNYSWNVWCNDSLGNGGWNYTSNATFVVDTTSITVTPNEPRAAVPTNLNFTEYPITVSVNVSGTNIDKIWYILTNKPSITLSTYTNQTVHSTSTIITDNGANPRRYNLSLNFSSAYLGPGDHGIWFCANNTAGTVTCNNGGAFSSGANAGQSAGFIIRGTNVTDVEDTFRGAGYGNLTIYFENGTKVDNGTLLNPLANNYTLSINQTDANGNEITVEIVGFDIDESRAANITNANQTVGPTTAIRDAIPGGHGQNLTFAWMDVARFLPQDSLYKYGRVILPTEYQRVRYCSGTYASPTCSRITNCSATIVDTLHLNYTNHATYIPSDSGCYIVEGGRTHIYLDKFSGAGGENDTIKPNVTVNYPKNRYNVSDNGTYINISFVDLSSGIDNSTIHIIFNTSSSFELGGANHTFTITNLTSYCYNRSAVTQLNPVNTSSVECYFNLADNFNVSLIDGIWSMNATVKDAYSNIGFQFINFSIDTTPPRVVSWNISNGSQSSRGVSIENGNYSQGLIQGATVKVFVTLNDSVTDTESAYLQVYNTSKPEGEEWMNITGTPHVDLDYKGNSTNFNASLVTNVFLLNATYTFCTTPTCNMSGANVSFRVYFTDSAGNWNITTNLTVTVNDTVKPDFTVTINGGGNNTNVSTTTISLNWSIEEKNDLSSIAWSLDGYPYPAPDSSGPASLNGGRYTVASLGAGSQGTLNSYKTQPPSALSTIPATGDKLANGTHWVSVLVNDSWGNSRQVNYSFAVDTTVPNVILGFDATDWGVSGGDGKIPTNLSLYGWALANVTFSRSGLDTLKYSTSCNTTLKTITNATKFQPFNETACSAASQSGVIHNLTIVATSGSNTVNTTIFTVGLDSVAPTVARFDVDSQALIDGLQFTDTNLSLNFSFSDFTYLSSIGYYIDDEALVILRDGVIDPDVGINPALSYNYSINVTDPGTHTLTLQANDSVGNAANSTTYTFSVAGPIDIDRKQLELNASILNDAANVNIRNGSGTFNDITTALILNSSKPVTLAIDIDLNTTGDLLNITIDGINSSAAKWNYLNFSVSSNDTAARANIESNFSTKVLKMVRFNSSLDNFLPNANSYFGKVVFGVNVTRNDSKMRIVWYEDETDYSSRTLIGVCTGAGEATSYTATQITPCYNITSNITTIVFVPHFSGVGLENDTITPSVSVNLPKGNSTDSAFIVNATVSQDTTATGCKFMVNSSGYYNGAVYPANTWKQMGAPALLSGTSQYVCLSTLPIALANAEAASGAYNLTINATDGNQNQNITYYKFNVSDYVAPQYSNIVNSSITATGATVTLTSNEYVNASVIYLAGTVVAQGSPFTTKTPTITISGLSASTVYNYTVQVCDYAGNCNTTTASPSYNFTTIAAAAAAAAAEEAAAAAGGGGGIAAAAAKNIAAKTSHLWSSLGSGESGTMTITNDKIGFREIEFTAASELANVKLEISSLKEKPGTLADASDKVYQYLQVAKTNLADDDISSATITFDVTKAWLADKGVAESDVTLLRYKDTEWNILPTKLVTSGDLKVTYEATTPGFSYFAIGSRAGVEEVALPTEEPTERPPVEVPTEAPTEVPIEPTKPPVSTTLWVIIAVIAIIVLGAIIYKSQVKKPAKQEKK